MKKLRFLLIFSLFLGFFCLSFADETLTITTYYPSPYGSYSQLQANQLSVGDTNADSQMTSVDLPPTNGQIYAARGIILKPQSSLPSSNLVTGELVYKDSDKKLYSYDGSAWAAVGGSAGSSGVTMMSARSASAYTHANCANYCYNLSATAAVAMNGDTTTTYSDWRFPTAGELAVFEGTTADASWIWTSSPYGSGDNWLRFNLAEGRFNYFTYDNAFYARCVR